MISKGEVSNDFRKQVLGYGLTAAEIVYRRPDRHWLLQTYVWRNYDMFPDFPALKDFLSFWAKRLDGSLFAVTVAQSKLVKPAELRAVDGVIQFDVKCCEIISSNAQRAMPAGHSDPGGYRQSWHIDTNRLALPCLRIGAHLESDRLAQGGVIPLAQRADVKKHVVATVIRLDKAEAFVLVKHLDFTVCHAESLFQGFGYWLSIHHSACASNHSTG